MTRPACADTREFGHGLAFRWCLGLLIFLWIGAFIAVREVALANGGVLVAWDVAWYMHLAQVGYNFNGDPSIQQTVAFLPLYPALLKLLLWAGLGKELIVCWLPVVLAASGMALLGLVIEHLAGARRAAWTMALFMASPFSLYFLNGYSESLYLLLLGGCLYVLIVRRNMLVCALLAGVATAVRPHALILLPFCMAWQWSMASGVDGRRKVLLWMCALAPAFLSGFFVTGIYYWWMYGDTFLYKNIMVAWGFDQYSDGWRSVGDHALAQIKHLSTFEWPLLAVPVGIEYARLQLFASIAVLGVVLCSRKWAGVLLFGLLLIAFVLVVTEGTVNLGRHLATNFTLPLALVILADRFPMLLRIENARSRRTITTIVLASALLAGLLLQAKFTWAYYHQVWVS